MNYELAKKLKNARFPEFKEKIQRMHIDQDMWNVPTLSELIEAIGWRFACVGKSVGEGKKDWYACSGGNYHLAESEMRYDLLRNGETPSEAVAELWLALNETKQK